MQFSKKLLFILLTLGPSLLIYSCSEDEGNTPTPEVDAKQVKLANDDNLGSYLVNQDGRALYFFSRDVSGSSACADGCLDSWPIFFDENLEIGNNLDEADFGSITRADGQKQTTYKGWPLYYYSGDSGADQINGDGVGKVWFVAKPDYSVMLANQIVEGNGGDPIHYLVDAEGNSLYYFLNDEENISKCTEGCIQSWPVFDQDATSIPSALEKSRFAVITRDDGFKQLTYDSKPIYFFAQDIQRGDAKGAVLPNWTISRFDW